MASNALNNVLQRLRTLATLQQANQCQDRELLERFIQQHDETAFTALVERHGPMVLRVCNRVLRQAQDAEDACQATFLVLVRRAAAIRKLNSLSCWLHGVAFRVAMKLRTKNARAQRLLQGLPAASKEQEAAATKYTWNELSAVLDEELERLPEKFRAPLVLCCLQDKTRDEASQELGCKPGALKGRLEWGRKLLRQRLARRGVVLSAALLAAGLGQSACAAIPPSLAITVVKSGMAVAVGKSLAAAVLSPQIAFLAQSCLRAMLFKQIQSGVAVLLMMLCVAGTGWFVHDRLLTTEEPGPIVAAAPLPKAPRAPDPALPDPAPLLPEEKNVPSPPKLEPPSKEKLLLERGDHVANKVAHCGYCHTPRNTTGEFDLTRLMQGAHLRSSPIKAGREREDETPDLTPTRRAGRWSEEKMVKFLLHASRERSHNALPKLTLEDAQAVTAYLRSLPGKKKGSKRDDD